MSRQRSGAQATLRPTARRRREARRQGQIAHSPALTGLAVTAAATLALVLAMGPAARLLTAHFRQGLATASSRPLDEATAALGQSAELLLLIIAPVLAAALVGALLMGSLQVGVRWSWLPLAPRLSRLDPAAGAARLLSLRRLGDLGRLLLALAGLGAVALLTFRQALPGLLASNQHGPQALAAETQRWSLTLAWRGGLVLLVSAVVDYLVRRHRLEQDLRMTREEHRREQRAQEGDPQRKRERRRLHRELLDHDMFEQLQRADVVLAALQPPPQFRPLAVALRYDAESRGAPRVVASGQGLVAERIKQLARRRGLPIVQDAALARALHALGPGSEIPADQWDAVADVLLALDQETRVPA